MILSLLMLLEMAYKSLQDDLLQDHSGLISALRELEDGKNRLFHEFHGTVGGNLLSDRNISVDFFRNAPDLLFSSKNFVEYDVTITNTT